MFTERRQALVGDAVEVLRPFAMNPEDAHDDISWCVGRVERIDARSCEAVVAIKNGSDYWVPLRRLKVL